jgi:hypothetical protein
MSTPIFSDKKITDMTNCNVTTCYHCGREFRTTSPRLYCTSKCKSEDKA